MALRSLIQLRGLLETIPGGSKNIAPTDLTNSTPPSVEIQVVLANGDNTVNVPALADGCLIVFDPTSTTVKTIKKTGAIAGDGIIVSKNKWVVLTFDTTPIASFLIESSAVDTGKYTTIIFF